MAELSLRTRPCSSLPLPSNLLICLHTSMVTFVNDSNAAKDTLGQITSYAAVQLSAQFWTHIYSVLIVRNTARILQWDRSGTIVMEAFDYNQSPYLVEFFRWYSAAPAAMRGKDETVSTPGKYEAHQARKALKLSASIPIVQLSVPGPNDTLRVKLCFTVRGLHAVK